MDEETKQHLDNIISRLEGIEGTLADFDALIHNHITDYSAKFGRLKQTVEHSITTTKGLAEVRDKALHQKIDAYKWGLVLVASFAVICAGGLIALAVAVINWVR